MSNSDSPLQFDRVIALVTFNINLESPSMTCDYMKMPNMCISLAPQPLDLNWLREGTCICVKRIRSAEYVNGLDIVQSVKRIDLDESVNGRRPSESVFGFRNY